MAHSRTVARCALRRAHAPRAIGDDCAFRCVARRDVRSGVHANILAEVPPSREGAFYAMSSLHESRAVRSGPFRDAPTSAQDFPRRARRADSLVMRRKFCVIAFTHLTIVATASRERLSA